jgi:hypothetical protein
VACPGGVSVGSVDVFGSTAPHGPSKTAVALTVPTVARTSRAPVAGPSVNVVEATPREFVTVGVGEIVSDVDGALTKDQTTDSPATGAPLLSTNVAVTVNGVPHTIGSLATLPTPAT